MIKEFEVINKKEDDSWNDYIYRFRLDSNTYYYSHYSVSKIGKNMIVVKFCYEDPELKKVSFGFPEKTMDEIIKFILNQKEIRMRHLFKPYRIY